MDNIKMEISKKIKIGMVCKTINTDDALCKIINIRPDYVQVKFLTDYVSFITYKRGYIASVDYRHLIPVPDLFKTNREASLLLRERKIK